ncbi:MAG TPA: PAS domain-containing protein, partial [Candidatus Acidoferrales bacterium]|nr:PAS domain-containing protein [Candidatus Acidoferrales bacterium]
MEGSKPDWLRQMEGILEALNEGVMIVDDCNQVLFANDRLVEMTPFSREEILGRTPAHFYSGDDLKFLMEQIARGEEQGSNRFEFYLVGPSQVRLPVIISSRVIEDPDGRRFAVVTFTDIRAQKHAQQQLEQANAQLEKRQREIETELALASRVQQSLAPRGLRWGR